MSQVTYVSQVRTLGQAHTVRVMPSKQEQRIRQILLGIGGVILVFLTFRYLQMSQQAELVDAARTGSVQGVRTVLDSRIAGLNLSPAMEAAVQSGKGNVVRYLLSKKVSPNIALEAAARQGNADIFRLLVESGGNIKGERGGHLLRLAAQSGSKTMVALLLKYGADREASNTLDDQMTPLHYAARSGQAGVVKVLLDGGANVRTRTGTGRSALMLAAVWNDPAACKFLIDKGADINARDEKGQTALMQASVVGNTQTMAYLLSRGASTKLKDSSGKTAFDHAVETGDTKVLNLLRRGNFRTVAMRGGR
jgi:ankyrin repeat protein